MNHRFPKLEGLTVSVENVMYVPSIETPEDKPHAFVYFITVRNLSPQPVRLMARKWCVREANGEVLIVEGDGVVGETPLIDPGSEFSYNSYHVVAYDAEVKGSLFGVTDGGDPFCAAIPKFELRLPNDTL